jgi:dTDP-3,4-didehydro-2,6-dideoxy-alpha-D-glucose 3-reductase
LSTRPGQDRPLRVGVLGCGDITWRNALPAMERVDGVQVTALASRDPVKAERYARQFGGEPVTGYANLLARSDVDAVYVAVPTGLHHQWARQALEAGKHVLVEKPFTASVADAEDLVETARKRELWVAENFTFPHHAQHAAIRDLIAGGAVGEPRAFAAAFGIPPRDPSDVRYRADLGGGALLDVGSYVVRAARLFLGDELAVLGSVLRMDAGRGVDLGGSALLCSAGGVPAELTFSFQTSYRSTYAMWGSAGRVSLQRAYITPQTWRPVVRVERQDHVEELTLPADDQFGNSVRAFAEGVLGSVDFEPHAAGLVRQAELVERIWREARRVPS